MAIKFICSCGKHLRARDEMAARRSMCPRCGAPVGIPSLRPTHGGTVAAPMTPQERMRRNRGKSAEANRSATPPPDTLGALTQPRSPSPKKRQRRARQLERHWYQCLSYPFLNMALLYGLALILSALTIGGIQFSSELARLLDKGPRDWLELTPGLLLPLLVFAYAGATVECALTSALGGHGPGVYWPGWRAGEAIKSCLRWLLGLLAGPLLPAVTAGYFWLYGGDLTMLDWIILAELGVLAAAYWFLLLVSMNESSGVLAVSPLGVARLAHRLGYRAAVPILVVPALLFAHAWAGFLAAEELHDSFLIGAFSLWICWCSALFCAMFLFRLLGVWCYRGAAAEGGP